MIKASVGLLAIPADPDTLHAAMRLCLRLTRFYRHAESFARIGGVKLLLGLSQVKLRFDVLTSVSFEPFRYLALLVVPNFTQL